MDLRFEYGENSAEYTQERIKERCVRVLVKLQENQSKEADSAGQLMISEVRGDKP